MLLEKLQHIHENLCFESRIKPPNPYREMRPVDFTNKIIKSCQDCRSKFSLEDGSAELVCVNCARIEILDDTAFLMRKTYNTHTKSRLYTFKYRLQKRLDNCRYPVKLYPSQINEACCMFKYIQNKLPKTNMLSLCDLQNPRTDYNRRATTHGSTIYTNKNTGFYISKTRTEME